jgi:cysteinyl-tRNA synthetase
MSKSLGNFTTIAEILELYTAEALRYFLLTVHYRHGLNFEIAVVCPQCRQVLDSAQQTAGRCAGCGRTATAAEWKQNVVFPGVEESDDRVAYVYATLQAARRFLAESKPLADDGPIAESVAEMLGAFTAAMRQDFNTPAALAALSRPLGEVNRLLAARKGIDRARRYRTVRRFVDDMKVVADVIGCFAEDPDRYLTARRDQKARRIGLDVARVEELVARRVAARRSQNWSVADELRDELADLGVTVQDGPEGSVWTL